MITQKLTSGIVIRQDLAASIRAVFFQTEYEEFLYATDGGTLFVVRYRDRYFGLTCRHVFGSFEPKQLFISRDKHALKGTQPAPIAGTAFASAPTGAAVGSVIDDICVIEFEDSLPADFFRSTAYVIDAATAGTSQVGHELHVFGVLKDKSHIDPPDIVMGYCQLRLRDVGVTTSDFLLRQASADFHRPEFTSVVGVSGAPVFDATAGMLCGMVTRGGMVGTRCHLHYFDIADVIQILNAVAGKRLHNSYEKVFPPGSIVVGRG